MKYSFDSLAENYSFNVKALPENYIDLISNTFNLSINTKVLDLGCGTGLLTFPIYERTHNVEGLDISYNMIELAKKRDKEDKIKWINADAVKYKLPKTHYDLIIAYESMHLFSNVQNIIESAAYGLKQGGYLCMGWCSYNWELILEKDIIDIFRKHGVIWGEWGYQKFDSFSKRIQSMKYLPFSQLTEKYVCASEKWSVKEIVEYITSISKVLTMNIEDIYDLKRELTEHLLEEYGNIFCGETQYWIRYIKKEGNESCD